jgi:hypothetical protein
MQPPQAFKYFVSCFYQGSLQEYGSQHEWISSRVGILTARDKAAVKAFLENLLNGQHEDREIQAAWASGDSCYFFNDAALKRLLAEALAILSASKLA